MSLEIFELIQILLAILGAFISEDITLITLSTLKASGKIDPMVYFIGAIVGIVLSDVFLYTVGRFWASKKKSFLWINFERLKDKVDEYKGSKFLFIFFARFIPGTRFPTYVSAGITKYPFYLFLPTILIAIFIWVYLFSIFGKLLFEKISENKWHVLLIFILLIVFVRIILDYKNIRIQLSFKLWLKAKFYGFQKYFYYEFWPAKLFYVPVFIFYVINSLRYNKTIGFALCSVNPAIENGGFIGESKTNAYRLISQENFYFLKNASISKEGKIEEFFKAKEALNLDYPLILKPELGQRGMSVKLVKSQAEALQYLKDANFDIFIQQYCPFENEAGIFYIKHPEKEKSQIFSITNKLFPFVVGDGKSNMAELILKDKRARIISSVYFKRFEGSLKTVPQNGQKILLVNSGNHAQGAIFEDGMQQLYTKQLHKTFDEIVSKMPGFLAGRFDVRYKDIKSFKQGKDFKIIEVNGSGAEATHIYDSKYSIFKAYSDLYNQIKLMYEIGTINQKNGVERKTFWQIIKAWRSFKNLSKNYKVAS